MTILNIVKYPSPILSTPCKPVKKITEDIKSLINDMLETMYDKNGIGLAANQVGVNLQIAVIDLQEDEKKNPIILINPKILDFGKEITQEEEGCLSMPNILVPIKRYNPIKCEYLNINMQKENIEAEGLLSICLQHEIDHLNGIMFIDRLSILKKNLIINKYNKLIKEATKK